ncbi:MAG: helix-turn-helix domain-containing protein [Candidatus Shapirobacteria bacterium]|jgi:sugar-specific transcriptional regulator TrmB
MSEQADKIYQLLKPYGLDQEESNIYLYLLEKGSTSALGISRELGVARTKVYRILDRLIENGMVVSQVASSGFKFVASEPLKLQMELTRREGELVGLRKNLPDLVEMLETRSMAGVAGSKILYYRGQKGLSQVNWNLLNARGEFLSYEVATADAYIPQEEAEKLRKELVKRKIVIRTLTNKTLIEPFTKVVEMVENYWQVRYIPKEIVDVRMDIFIYNNIMAVCHYLEKKDVFCMEMINEPMVEMQKQIFENLWSQAKIMEIKNSNGAAEVIGSR